MTLSEARFTAPRPDCPHPEWWHSDDEDSTEREVTELVAAFVCALQPELVVETGSAWGQTAEAIGRALDDNGHGRLVTLEPDPDRARATAVRCEGLPVDVVVRASLDWMPNGPVGFAWFDSLIELRADEFRRYLPWLRGSIVGFHDAGPHHHLRPDLDRLAAEGLMRPIYLPTPRGACFAEVL